MRIKGVVAAAALLLLAALVVAVSGAEPGLVTSEDLLEKLHAALDQTFEQVSVNVLLVGFTGDDRQLNLSNEYLEPWLSNMLHSQQHTFIQNEASEHTCANHRASHTAVVAYNFNYKVVSLGTMVDTVLGAAITTFMRPVDPSEQQPRLFQVDPDRMDPLIDSLVHSLGFGGSHNIIVWNPKPLLKPGRSYGYRSGFSAAEMAIMAQDDAISDLIDELSVDEDAEAAARHSRSNHQRIPETFMRDHDANDEAARPTKRQREPPLPELELADMIAASDDWARDFLAQNAVVLQQQADAPTDALTDACALPPTIFIKGDGERRQADAGHADHAHVINMQRNMSLAAAAAFTMRSSSVAARNRLRRIAQGFPEQEACLSESWVFPGRTAFLDLGAGPFHWGDTIGTRGFKGEADGLNVTAAVLGTVRRYRFGRVARPPIPHQEHMPAGGRIGRRLLASDTETDDAWLSSALKEYCASDDPVKQEVCRALRAQERNKQGDGVPLFSGSSAEEAEPERPDAQPIIDAAQPDSVWSLYRSTHHAALIEDIAARLSALLSRTVKLLLTPSTRVLHSLPRPPRTWIVDVFVVRAQDDGARTAPLAAAAGGFDYETFKAEVSKLALPGQQIQFTLNEGTLAEDAGLASAVYGAIHSATIAEITDDASVQQLLHVFLDSEHLQRILARRRGDRVRDDSVVRHLPVFLFSIDFQHPLLIDDGEQAVALSEMVVGVQSPFSRWPTHLECNGRLRTVNLRDPTRALVLATAQHIGGLLPAHLGNCGNALSAPDWLWTVGDAARSPLAAMPIITGFDVDIALRHWGARWADSLVERLNEAVYQLRDLRGSQVALTEPLRARLLDARQSFIRALGAAEDFSLDSSRVGGDPQPTLEVLERHVLAFETQAKDLYDSVFAGKCAAPSMREALLLDSDAADAAQAEIRLMWLLALAIATVLIVLVWYLRKDAAPRKVKIN